MTGSNLYFCDGQALLPCAARVTHLVTHTTLIGLHGTHDAYA